MTRSSGFTLLECLIALLIVALVMGGSLYQVSIYADQRATMEERFASHTVAWNRLMEQYQLVNGWTAPNAGLSSSSGNASEFGQIWNWELEAVPTLADNFFRYEVRVYPEESGQETEIAGLLAAYFIAR